MRGEARLPQPLLAGKCAYVRRTTVMTDMLSLPRMESARLAGTWLIPVPRARGFRERRHSRAYA